jgi:phage gp36-like protein
MNFCTTQDLRDRLGDSGIRDFLNLADDADLSLNHSLIRSVEYANAYIAGRVRAKYELPLKENSALLAGLAVDVAIWRLYSANIHKLSDQDRENIRFAFEQIADIENGRLDLGEKSKEEENWEASPSAFSLDGSDNTEVFGKTWMKDW